MPQDLNDPVWTLVASFLPLADRFPLLGLCRSVVHSPLRVAYFAETKWHIPPLDELATRVLDASTMKSYITTIHIETAEQLRYLNEFPALESVSYGEAQGEQPFPPSLPVDLKRLTLRKVDVPLDELTTLTKLETLTLNSCSVSSTEESMDLLSVTELALAHCPDETFEWSSKVPNLRVLRAVGTPVDPGYLTELEHLEELHLCDTKIHELVELTEIGHQLKVLDLKQTPVGDATFDEVDDLFDSLVQVEKLDLQATAFLGDDLTMFAGLSTLKSLKLSNAVSDLTPLMYLTNLESLSVFTEPDVDWTPIQELKKLRKLDMHQDFNIVNASASWTLQQLPLLTTLKLPPQLSSTQPLLQVRELEISGLLPQEILFEVGCCPNVVKLTVTGGFNLASVVASFPKLTELNLADFLVYEDFRSLGELKQLETLRLSSCGRKSSYEGFAFLAELTGLRTLCLDGTVIEDLTVLAGMEHLTNLFLDYTPIDDISVLAELRNLRELSLRGCSNLANVSSVYGLPSLTTLVIDEHVDCAPLVENWSTGSSSLKTVIHEQDWSCLWTHSADHPRNGNHTDQLP